MNKILNNKEEFLLSTALQDEDAKKALLRWALPDAARKWGISGLEKRNINRSLPPIALAAWVNERVGTLTQDHQDKNAGVEILGHVVEEMKREVSPETEAEQALHTLHTALTAKITEAKSPQTQATDPQETTDTPLFYRLNTSEVELADIRLVLERFYDHREYILDIVGKAGIDVTEVNTGGNIRSVWNNFLHGAQAGTMLENGKTGLQSILQAAGEEYPLLKKALGADKFDVVMNLDNWVESTPPSQGAGRGGFGR